MSDCKPNRVVKKSCVFALSKLLVSYLCFFSMTPVLSQEVWSVSPITFSKAALADPLLAANQDRITADVWLTRGNVAGLFNAAVESFYDDPSPAGTRWAFSGLGNPTGSAFSADNYSNLEFSSWVDSLGGRGVLQSNILNRPAVLHLVNQDIYIDITFNEWANGEGRFSYTRASAPATAVPYPGYSLLVLLFVLALLGRRFS